MEITPLVVRRAATVALYPEKSSDIALALKCANLLSWCAFNCTLIFQFGVIDALRILGIAPGNSADPQIGKQRTPTTIIVKRKWCLK